MKDNREIQKTTEGGREVASLPVPFDPEAVKLRASYFGYTAIPSAILLEIMTQGQLGDSLAVAAMIGGAFCYWGPQLHKVIGPGWQMTRQMWGYLNRNNSGKVKHHLMDKNWWLYGEVSTPYAEEEETEEEEQQGEESEAPAPLTLEQAEGKVLKMGKNEYWIPPQFLMDEIISVMKDFNKRGLVYFGESEEGSVAVKLSKMYHVMDVSSSGKGKSNRFRLAMMQLVNTCKVYYINPIAASVKGVTDKREIEVWQPIYDRLANKRPVQDGGEIRELLTKLTNLIDERNALEKQRDFSWMKKPVFLFIDEQPEVYRLCPEAAELLDKIGRMGRNYCVFIWIATQTAQVEDIGLSTPTQANMKTRIYGGADSTSGNRAMKGGISKDQERILQGQGEGLTLILADGMSELTLTRSPLVTNEAMFSYLNLGPFHKEDWMKKPQNPISTSGDGTISRGISRLSPLEDEVDIAGDSDLEPLEITNSENEIVLSQAQKMKLLRVLEADMEGISQNKIVLQIWGHDPSSREGRAATDELRTIRAYIAQEQRKHLGI